MKWAFNSIALPSIILKRRGKEDFKDVPPDQEVEIEEPLSSKRFAPRPKKERADNWKEMVDYALIDTKLGNFVLWKLKAPSVES